MKRLLFILLLTYSQAFAQTSGAKIHNIMRTQIAPNADALFSLQEKTSVTDKEWADILKKLSNLHDAAHKLKTINNVPEWKQHVDKIDMLTEQALAQSVNRNIRGLADTGNKMFNVCMSCHTTFFPKGKNL